MNHGFYENRINRGFLFIKSCVGYTLQSSGDYLISGVIKIDLNITAKDLSSDETTVITTTDKPREEDICGLASTSRIVGGEEADPGQFPLTAALLRIDWNDRLWCGGAIISNRFILTAAHCIKGKDQDLFKVRLGLFF